MNDQTDDPLDPLPSTTSVRHKFPLSIQFARLAWGAGRIILFRPFSNRLFRKWRVLVLRCFGAEIAWSCTVHGSVRIWAPWNLKMGQFSCMGPDVDCYNQGEVVIEENATISQKVYICASSHDYTDPGHALILCPILVGSRAWVAADSFLGPGVTIGEGAVIGARAVVTRSMPEWMVCAGNPCKPLKKREMRVS